MNFKLTKDGTIVGERATPTNPNTPAQQAARARFTTSSKAFRNFTPNQETAWQNYAQTLGHHDRVTGGTKRITALNAYLKLASKFLQVNNGGTAPTTPPVNAYNGDNITLAATAGVGKVTFTASGANSLSTKTELLLQPLASRLRNPKKNGYRSMAFNAFAAGNLSLDVTVGPGWYAAGYRFVNTATGQSTEMVPLGVSQVTFSVSAAEPKKKAA